MRVGSLGPASIETAIYYTPLDGAIWSALPVRTSSPPPLPRVSTTVTLSPASQSVAWAHSQGQAQGQAQGASALAEMKKAMMQDPVFRAAKYLEASRLTLNVERASECH